MKKRKRVSIRVVNIMGHPIPLDLCWGNHKELRHVHNVHAQDDMGGGVFKNVREAIQVVNPPMKRWCRECVTGYKITTDDSRAFYEVVRLNGNEFTGGLPPELIMEIYKHLLKKPLLFTECSERIPTERNPQ